VFLAYGYYYLKTSPDVAYFSSKKVI